MTQNELTELLQSDDPDESKKALQYIKMLIGKKEKIADDILILMLKSNSKAVYNTALKYLIRQKQKIVLSKMPIPAQLEKDAIFNHACYELWRYVRKKGFDTSREGAIERFLYVVCRSYISHAKNRRGGGSDIGIHQIPEPSENPSPPYDAEAYEAIEELFSRLGKGCKEILMPKYFEGKKFKEIAEDTNRDIGVIKVTSSRCMKKLRTWVAENDKLAKYIKDLLN